MSNHVSFEDLAELAERREKQDAAQSSHLAECSECAATLEQLQHTFTLMATDTTQDAPRGVLFQAISIFQPAAKASLIRRVVAVLSFDSLNTQPAFGTRSGATEVRQLIYSAGETDIDLHISVADNNWIIAGQLLGESCVDGEVTIESGDVAVSGKLNESCEFKLPSVPSGDYKLRLRLSHFEVEVPRIELRR